MRQAPQVVNRDGLYCLCGAKPGLYPSSEKDLDHARFALEKGFYEWAAFSAQQSAPRGWAWGHSVLGLLEELAKWHPVSESLLDAASELDKAYIPTRYPDALPEGAPFERYRRPEAERLLRYAEEIYAFCQGLLPSMD